MAITTIKLQKDTKKRLEKLKEHKRETYDEIIRKMLYVLSLVKIDSDKAVEILEKIDEMQRKMLEIDKDRKEKEKLEKKN